MCGIAFIYRPGLKKEQWSKTMATAMGRLAHRGPDGSGQICNADWCIGHQRLSIIDPPGSSQPFADPGGRYFLSYNGELYNFVELRNRLKDQWKFSTAGDTEVVMAGLVTYGVAFLRLMEGMWALAFWDRQERNLLLVRDRMGQKPLYYHCDRHHFACASEIRALSALSRQPWQEDFRSTADYFRYGFFIPGTTIYKGVREVLPGHWLKWSPGEGPKEEHYWRLSPGGFYGRREEAVELIEKAVVNGVEERLVADVEVGALLSGGIDSSLIVSIIANQLNREIKTFTMGFEDPAYDERRYARAWARHCRTQHFDQHLALEHSDELVQLIIEKVGQPFGDASLLPAAMVSRMVSNHLKVVLSGDGGDELFSGYDRYTARAFLRWYTRLPIQIKNSVIRWTDRFPKKGLGGLAGKRVRRLIDMVRRMENEIPYVAPVNYHLERFRQLIPDIWRKANIAPNMIKTTRLDDVHEMMLADALIYLPQDILTKLDRAGMAFSVEIRSPFLDRRLVELAFSLPRKWHRNGAKGKQLIKTAFRQYLPESIWRRPKHGFAVPLDRWFRSGLELQIIDLLDRTMHPLNDGLVRTLIGEHRTGQWDHGVRLWHIYIYLRWLDAKPWSRQ